MGTSAAVIFANMARAERIVLVDGSWLIYRAFFAIPPNLTTRDGLHTNAIYGFATMFRKLFTGRRPDRGAVVFDTPEQTHREAKYPEYKAQRPAMADELREQLTHIDRVVAANRFPALRLPGYEADDVIGTLATRAAAAGMDVLIVAADKDYAQLVDERIRMIDTLRDVTYDAALVEKKWGVRPERIAELLALMGDTSDNIPGVPGIGQKGAATLLQKYGSLSGILAHTAELPAKQRATLDANAEKVALWHDLATIDRNAPVEVSLDALVIPAPEPAALNALYKELEFYSLLTESDAADARDATIEAQAVRVCTSLDEVRALVARLPQSAPVAVAPLYWPLVPVATAQLVGLALAATPGEATYVPVASPTGALGREALEVLRPWLEDEAREKTAHDVKQLDQLCARSGIALSGARFDTMIASFLVEPSKCIPHRLDQVAKEYLQRTVRPLKSVTGSGQSTVGLAEVPLLDVAAYAGHLAETILSLDPVLRARLAEAGQEEVFRTCELPLAFVLGQMELAGIGVDSNDLAQMQQEFETRKAEFEKNIYVLAGHEFNIGSTKQLAEVLFEELKLPVIKKTKTGYSTDAEVLERLAPKHAIAQLILSQRELAKLINTYTNVLREAVQPETGRIHATFQQTAGVSGRLISTDPDLQRTPVRTPEGKRIRRAFVAPPGMKIISADWSQIELRVLAHFSKDPALVDAFRTNRDLHRQTAALLFRIAPEEVTPEQRGIGKTVNFATIYGQGATALGQILGIPRKEAQSYIEAYFTSYAGVRAWLDRTIADALQCGYVTTLLGRRRVIPELASRSDIDRAAGERIAANTPIQGSAAELCKLAMLKIAAALPAAAPGTRMLLQVHDELVFESPDAEVEAASAVVRASMQAPYPLDVPLVVGLGVGASWGDAH